MSLDQNLFTLIFTPNKDHPNVTDLVDPSETVHYHKRRVPGQEYKIEVFDPMSESLLITATAPSTSSKVKILELYNPTKMVEFKSTGTLSFRWSFKWEEHEFEWKREQCFLIRKPDPPVLVAVTKEQSRQVKNTQVQILDYNLHRFDIDDRKGLEIVLLTALMTFHDSGDAVPETPVAEQAQSPSALVPPPPPPSISRRVSAIMSFGNEAPPPPPPPKPAPRTGLDRIREMQEMKGEEYNEITVEDEGTVEDYGQYCSDLLSDDAMLFISVKSSAAAFVPKVLQVVEETKRVRYKAGLDDDAELHQYVLYDTEKKKGPKRINLNDDADQKAKYAPPESLTVHLSKIDMPELAPKSTGGTIKGKDKKVTTAAAAASAAPSLSASSGHAIPKPSSKPPKPPAPSPSAQPTPPPSTPSGSSSFFSSKPKQPKNKLTKQSKERPTSTPPPPPQAPQSQPPPPTGIFNAHPHPPAQSSGPISVSFPARHTPPPPSFPVPYGNDSKDHSGGRPGASRGEYETPGLSLYNTYMPHTPGPPPPPPQHPPPPPQHYSQPYGQSSGSSGSGSNRPLSTVGGIAESVVSGIFGMVKNASSQARK